MNGMTLVTKQWLDCHDIATGRYCKIKAAQAKRERKAAKRKKDMGVQS